MNRVLRLRFVALRFREFHHLSRLRTMRGLLVAILCASGYRAVELAAQTVPIPGRNVNMVSGMTWPDGDPFLQRQNEPSIAVSTRNPRHLLAGANDYRTVDLPFITGLPEGRVTGDAWLGVFKST